MVMQRLQRVARGRRETVQPAVKRRGREYLRVIHGPGYIRPEKFHRLRSKDHSSVEAERLPTQNGGHLAAPPVRTSRVAGQGSFASGYFAFTRDSGPKLERSTMPVVGE